MGEGSIPRGVAVAPGMRPVPRRREPGVSFFPLPIPLEEFICKE